MSQHVLAGPFLDFGATYWGSSLMLEEHPGLLSKGFSAEGKYGIGFFSVFMDSTKVQVITRQSVDSIKDTRVLEFNEGLKSRPIIRSANDSERMIETRTTVKVWLETAPFDDGGLLAPGAIGAERRGRFRVGGFRRNVRWTLHDLVKYLLPASDVNVYCTDINDSARLAVKAGELLSINGIDLINNCMIHVDRDKVREQFPDDLIKKLGHSIMPITDNKGKVLGRACLELGRITKRFQYIDFGPGVITAGTFRASDSISIAGVILGRPSLPSRDEAHPLASEEHIAAWATEQAILVRSLTSDPKALSNIALIVRVLGGDTRDLPIAESSSGWMSYTDIIRWKSIPDRIFLAADFMAGLGNATKPRTKYILNDNAILADSTQHGTWYYGWAPSVQRKSSHPRWLFRWATLTGLVIEAVSKTWGKPLDDVLEASRFSDDDHSYREIIGTKGKKPLEAKGCDMIVKP